MLPNHGTPVSKPLSLIERKHFIIVESELCSSVIQLKWNLMYFIAINSYEDKQTIETVMSHNTKLPHCPCGIRQDFLRDIEARCTTLLSSSLYKETTFEVEHLCDVCSISVFK